MPSRETCPIGLEPRFVLAFPTRPGATLNPKAIDEPLSSGSRLQTPCWSYFSDGYTRFNNQRR